MHRGVEIRTARSQDNELCSKGASPSFLHSFPPLSLLLLLLPQPSTMSTKKRYLTSLVFWRPIVGSSSIWIVIHKSQTCILVHADQRDNQNRHELRERETPLLHEKQSSNKDIVNFNFELILHYYDLRIALRFSILLQTL